MVDSFLVTTALEETWQADEKMPIIFLGEWCKLYNRKQLWQELEHNVCPYHWDDRKKYYKDYLYILDLYELLLADLSTSLNKIHGINFSVRSWRILIGPWLGYFVQILFDRWCMIEYVCKEKNQLKTIVLTGQDGAMIPNDMNSFVGFLTSDIWNHFIYSSILKEFENVEIVERKYITDSLHAKVAPATSLNSKVKKIIKLTYNQLACYINKKQAPLFINTYLSWKDYLKLSYRFKQIPVLESTNAPEKINPDLKKRDWILEGRKQSNFENFVRKIIPQQIPISYLEGFTSLFKKSDTMCWPIQPKIIFTTNSFSSDDIFKMYAARKIQNKTPLVIGQHGGHYGIGKIFFNEVHELLISDKYLSWGWTDLENPKIKGVGQIIAKKPLGIKHSVKPNILLVTTTMPRYSYFMFSIAMSSQWIDYFIDQCRFVGGLSDDIRNVLTVRLHKNDFGWDQLERWNEKFPNLKYDIAKVDMKIHIQESRIFVSTYNATTYLESFTMNIPTVIFWNPTYSEIRENVLPYFEELKQVGIFHDNPESAALHINHVWEDVDAWWSSPEVTEVVNRFKRNFCYLTEKLVDNIEVELRTAIED
jgi:putative transferase (TIGR04331 family)